MFNLDPNPTFTVTVFISEPGMPGRPLVVCFKHQTASELKEFIALAKTKLTEKGVRERMIDHIDESEKAPGQTDADFLAILFEKYPAAPSDLIYTYMRELTESRVKNS